MSLNFLDQTLLLLSESFDVSDTGTDYFNYCHLQNNNNNINRLLGSIKIN